MLLFRTSGFRGNLCNICCLFRSSSPAYSHSAVTPIFSEPRSVSGAKRVAICLGESPETFTHAPCLCMRQERRGKGRRVQVAPSVSCAALFLWIQAEDPMPEWLSRHISWTSSPQACVFCFFSQLVSEKNSNSRRDDSSLKNRVRLQLINTSQ